MRDTSLRPSLPLEHWESIPGYEGLYDVSNQGRVWSRGHKHWMSICGARFVRHTEPKILSTHTDHGQERVRLIKHTKQRSYTVMSLMKKAFIHAS